MRRFPFKRLFAIAIVLSMVAAGVYSRTQSFAQQWRQFVIGQFEERGVHLDFERFGLSLLDGLVARDVRLYADAGRSQLMMTLDRLNLDLDYGRLMQKSFFVEGLELEDANVLLPLDPERADSGHIELSRFNARALLIDDRLEIRRAEGDLAGVHTSIMGTFHLPVKKTGAKGEKKDATLKVKLAIDRDQRAMIKHGVDWLQRFKFGQRPHLQLDLEGSLEKPDDLRATIRVSAFDVGYEDYVCRELSGTAEYHDRVLDVRRLMMRDQIGVFEASANWPIDADEVQFTVNTSTDLPKLARSFFHNDELREVVFYESSPPSLALEGKWFVRGPKATPRRPVEALGRLKFGRFTTRGEVFDGLSASFGVTPSGYYIRDALLRHKSGTMSLQAMSQDTSGFKYRAVLRMDPHAFLPFAASDAAREAIKRFEFQEHSTVFAQLDGEGSDASFAACRNVGQLELHDFKYRGVEFASWNADLELSGSKQVFKNVSMVPLHGNAFAAEVVLNSADQTVTLSGVKAKVDPVSLTSCFARDTAAALTKYHFGPDTEVEMDGVIGIGSAKVNDFTIRFSAANDSATYPLWGRDYKLSAPHGSFVIKGSRMDYEVKARVFGDAMTAKGHTMLGQGESGYDVDLSAGEFRHIVMGKDLPFYDLHAKIKGDGDKAPFDISAKILGGKMTLQGAFSGNGKSQAYHGELRVDAVSFPQFAHVYAPGNDSAGDITGHFEFSGKPDNWKALHGAGVLIILNGNLYALPVFGPLTTVLGALLPAPIKGYNIAKEANCNFQVADGFIVTRDFEALTAAFKLVADGSIDFINDKIDFNVQARARGLPGIVLRPVSELLEFKGEGPVGKPVWRNRLLSLGKENNGERKPPSRAELDAAQREAESQNGPAAPTKTTRERPIIRPLFK